MLTQQSTVEASHGMRRDVENATTSPGLPVHWLCAIGLARACEYAQHQPHESQLHDQDGLRILYRYHMWSVQFAFKFAFCSSCDVLRKKLCNKERGIEHAASYWKTKNLKDPH